MAGPTVTLTFAGDSQNLQQSFERVGDSARGMSSDVGSASDSIRTTGGSMDRVSQGFDTADTRAMGFRDTVTGVQDTFRGLTDDSMGLGERLLTLGMGVGDLASGFVNLLLPALQSVATFLRAGLARALTFVAAHPIILTITLLVALFVLLWTQSETFRNIVMAVFNAVGAAATWLWEQIRVGAEIIWGAIVAYVQAWWAVMQTVFGAVVGFVQAAWGGIQAGAQAVWNFLVNAFQTYQGIMAAVFGAIGGAVQAAWGGIQAGAQAVWNFLVNAFNGVRDTVSGVASAIRGAFRSAFNAVANAWNSTVGSLSFTVPEWVPVISGRTFNAPRIPTFHDGGRVPGAPGSEMLALLQAGETVVPAGRGGGGQGMSVTFRGDTDSALASVIMRLIRSGDIQIEGA